MVLSPDENVLLRDKNMTSLDENALLPD